MSPFQLIVVPALSAVVLWMAVRTFRHDVPWRTGALWTAVWATADALVALPSATAVVASWLGIGRGADLVLYGATLAGLGVSLYFYNRYRRLEEIVTVLVRREALRNARRGNAATDRVTVGLADSN